MTKPLTKRDWDKALRAMRAIYYTYRATGRRKLLPGIIAAGKAARKGAER